jgi:hypothetical protein
MTMSNEKDLDTAFSAIRKWYYSGIRSLVDYLIADIKTEEIDDENRAREWMHERVDEDTDSHNFVTYTFKAKCALLASDNEDAYSDEIGEPAPSVEAAACMAMRADAWELLNAREDEWLPQDCEHCCMTLPAGHNPEVVHDNHNEECSMHPITAAAEVAAVESKVRP